MDTKYNKIMIIDDNEIDRYISIAILRNNNFSKDILEFDGGLKAIEYLENNKDHLDQLPDIIFLDLYMPLVDGFQFMELYEKIEFGSEKKCKIYMVSSSIDDEDILRTKSNENFTAFLSKPITAEFLNSLKAING